MVTEEQRLRHNEQRMEQRRKRRLAAIAALGGECSRCGINDARVLELDHVYGTGHLEGRSRSAKVVRRINQGMTDGIQLLCANCHALKSWHKS